MRPPVVIFVYFILEKGAVIFGMTYIFAVSTFNRKKEGACNSRIRVVTIGPHEMSIEICSSSFGAHRAVHIVNYNEECLYIQCR